MKRVAMLWVAVVCGASSTAWGGLLVTPDASTLTGVKDLSNAEFGGAARYNGRLTTDPGDPDAFVNDVVLVPGVGFDAAIALAVLPDTLSLDNGTSYTLGTPIAGGTNFGLREVAYLFGEVAPSVAPGLYPFTVEFRGGDTSTANDVVASWDLALDVIDKLDVSVTAVAAPGTIGYGEPTTVSATLANHMASRAFVTSSWFYTGGGMEQGSAHLTGSFVGNWFDQSILPGESRTDQHTRWTANSASLPTGTYVGSLGLIGGLYYGDQYSFLAGAPVPTVELMPEPAGVLAAAGGVLVTAFGGGARRRRRA